VRGGALCRAAVRTRVGHTAAEIAAVNGDMNRADHFRAGLRKTDIDSVRDKFAFASNQHAAQDWYRGRIVKNDAGEYTVKTEQAGRWPPRSIRRPVQEVVASAPHRYPLLFMRGLPARRAARAIGRLGPKRLKTVLRKPFAPLSQAF
jgi:hypothetical protein